MSGTATPSVVDGTDNSAFETVDWGTLDGPDGPIDLGSVDATVAGTIGIGGATGSVIDPNMRTSSDTGARATKSRVFDLGREWQVNDTPRIRSDVALYTLKSDLTDFTAALDFLNPNSPKQVKGHHLTP